MAEIEDFICSPFLFLAKYVINFCSLFSSNFVNTESATSVMGAPTIRPE